MRADRFVAISYDDAIPNNVDLSSDKQLQRALETWRPKYLDWWNDMGPEGYQQSEVYLRTAVGVDAGGWAKFGYVKMPNYRWGALLAPNVEGRTIPSGRHKGQPLWPHARRGQGESAAGAQGGVAPRSPACGCMLPGEAHHRCAGEPGVQRTIEAACGAMVKAGVRDPKDVEAVRKLGVVALPLLQRKANF